MRTAQSEEQPQAPQPSQRGRVPIALRALAVGAVFVLGAVLLTVWLRDSRGSLDQMLGDARVALAEGDYRQAVQAFSRVLDDDPDNIEAVEGQLEAAAHLTQAGQFDDATAAYQQVWQKRPTDVRALQRLGQAYEARGEWEAAASWYEKWAQVAPNDGNAFLALGRARYKLDEYGPAVAVYERADALGVGSDEMMAHLGLAYYAVAQYDKASEQLQKVVSQDPEDLRYQLALGLSLYELGQPERAVPHLDKAAALGTLRFDDPLARVYQLLDLDFSDIVTQDDKTYAIAETGQRLKVNGAVQLVAGPWQGSQALVVEEETSNWMVNPSCERDVTTGWSFDGGTDGSRAQFTDDSAYGAGACKLEAPSDGGPLTFWQTISVTAESDYTFSVWAKNTDVDALPYLWVSRAGAASPITKLNLEGLSTDEWTRYTLTVTTPPGIGHADFGIGIPRDTSQGVFLLDAFQVEQKPYATTFCDGDQGTGYAWSGSPHASTSTRARTFVQYQPHHLNTTAGAIAIWLKPGQFYDWPFVFGSFPAKLDSYMAADGDIRFRIYDDAGEEGAKVEYALGASEADNWHHVVYVWSQTAVDGFNMWLYVDGTLRDQAMNAHWPTDLPIEYARLQPGARRVIARLTTFDRYLSAGEIAALYQAGVSTGR